jgi:hypothetical protein
MATLPPLRLAETDFATGAGSYPHYSVQIGFTGRGARAYLGWSCRAGPISARSGSGKETGPSASRMAFDATRFHDDPP